MTYSLLYFLNILYPPQSGYVWPVVYYMWHEVVGPVLGNVNSKLYIKHAAKVQS